VINCPYWVHVKRSVSQLSLALLLGLQIEIALARVASKVVMNLSVTIDRPETCDHFVVNPATGALEVAPTHRDEAAKAFQGVFGGVKARPISIFAVSIAESLRCRSVTFSFASIANSVAISTSCSECDIAIALLCT
jgi:hypothetical protein